MEFYITKSSGKKERFDLKKFKRSLKKAGASHALVEKVVQKVIQKIKTERFESTAQVHDYALKFLTKTSRPIAARYNLKRALMNMGPSGYPFEDFVAELLKHDGYQVVVGQIVKGTCVDHEVDVVAQKNKKHYMIECKFHHRTGLKSTVKVALYIQARFEDVREAWEKAHAGKHEFHQAWIVTNTRFTSEAEKYAKCRGIRLISWNYPRDNNLAQMIDRLGLHPITALTTLNKSQKQAFIKEGFVLCRDARKHKKLLKKLGFTPQQMDKLIAESEAVCELKTGS